MGEVEVSLTTVPVPWVNPVGPYSISKEEPLAV
jgi:hypothetical protein